MKRLLILALTAALMPTWPVSAQISQAAANDADLRCMVVVSVILGEMSDSEQQDPTMLSGLTGGLMFYYGRLRGRAPETDWLSKFGETAADFTDRDFEVHGERCSQEMMQAGAELVAFGDKMQARAQSAR